jgi:hypothetical protein
MSRIKDAIAALIDVLFSRWLWLPIFFFINLMSSLYLGVALGIYGYFIPYCWVYYLFIREIIRRWKSLPMSEAWETKEARLKELIENAEKYLKKTKPSPP